MNTEYGNNQTKNSYFSRYFTVVDRWNDGCDAIIELASNDDGKDYGDTVTVKQNGEVMWSYDYSAKCVEALASEPKEDGTEPIHTGGVVVACRHGVPHCGSSRPPICTNHD